VISLVSSDVKRITQVAASPVTSNVAEMFSGMLAVKSFEKTEILRTKFEANLQKMVTSEMHERYIENWVSYRIEMASYLIPLCNTFLIFMIKAVPINSLNKVSNLSLALSWGATSGEFISFLLFCFAEVMKGMNSVERILEVAESKDLEPDHDEPKPAKDWPTTGAISLNKINMRYRANLPLVLDQVSLTVNDREKVGIVGRTGSGKSSLILTLMRIIDIDKTGNQESFIKIDGVETDKVGLHHARSAITLIPQEAFVLSGTIRSNIDPNNKHKTDEIIKVLRMTKLYDSLVENFSRKAKTEENKKETVAVIKDEDLLDMVVESGGSNLSSGQKQLVCITRALIKKPRVLLMDEATASIDSKTDEIIQGLIKSEFRDSTILTIAHRLNTIIQYDKILSLKYGKVVEYGEPSDLLRDNTSYFRQLVVENGEEFYKQMLQLADEARSLRNQRKI
jgi:ATP-binding cassette subfamily C (CFTR/MRP) protein 2